MTVGNPTPLIAKFAFPLILTNIGQQLYQIVDAAIVGRGVGVEALAALGATDWLYWLVLWAITALTQGFSVLVAQRFGAGDIAGLKKAAAMSIKLCFVIGLTLTVLAVGLTRPVLILLDTPDNILDQACTYLGLMYAGTLIVIAYNMSAAFLRALGNGRNPLTAMGIAAVLNVLLDLLFILVFGWGIIGAAVATLTAQLFAFFYCFRVIRQNEWFHFTKTDWQKDRDVIRELLHLGVPLALQQQVVVFGGIIVQSLINSCGFLFVAGFTATNKLHGLLDCSAAAFGYAASTFVGQNWGAGKIDRIRSGIRKTLMLSISFSLVITAVMLIYGRQIVALFISGDAANADAVLQIAYAYLVVMSLFLFTAYGMQVFRASLQAMGSTRAPFLAGFVEFAGRVGAGLFLTGLLGPSGLYYTDGAAWLSSGLFLTAAYILFMRETLRIKGNNNS